MSYVYGPVTTSDEQSASAVAYASQSHFHSLELLPPTTGYATLKIYDSATATTSGKRIIAEASVSAGMNSIYLALPAPRICLQGIYAVITDTSGTSRYVVGFSPT